MTEQTSYDEETRIEVRWFDEHPDALLLPCGCTTSMSSNHMLMRKPCDGHARDLQRYPQLFTLSGKMIGSQ